MEWQATLCNLCPFVPPIQCREVRITFRHSEMLGPQLAFIQSFVQFDGDEHRESVEWTVCKILYGDYFTAL